MDTDVLYLYGFWIEQMIPFKSTTPILELA